MSFFLTYRDTNLSFDVCHHLWRCSLRRNVCRSHYQNFRQLYRRMLSANIRIYLLLSIPDSFDACRSCHGMSLNGILTNNQVGGETRLICAGNSLNRWHYWEGRDEALYRPSSYHTDFAFGRMNQGVNYKRRSFVKNVWLDQWAEVDVYNPSSLVHDSEMCFMNRSLYHYKVTLFFVTCVEQLNFDVCLQMAHFDPYARVLLPCQNVKIFAISLLKRNGFYVGVNKFIWDP